VRETRLRQRERYRPHSANARAPFQAAATWTRWHRAQPVRKSTFHACRSSWSIASMLAIEMRSSDLANLPADKIDPARFSAMRSKPTWPRRDAARCGAQERGIPQRRAPKPAVGSKVLTGHKEMFGTPCRATRFAVGAHSHHPWAFVGRSPMSRDEDGISNSFWLLFASLLTSVAIGVSAIMAGIM
jgi:hypothetical protein